MTVEIPEEDEAALARLLESLGSHQRLALLRQLRLPRTLSEMRVRAEQSRKGENPGRLLTRQAVRAHLDWLVDSGFVRSRESRRGPLPVEEYLVNHPRLFALAEEIRQLGARRPSELEWDAATSPLAAHDAEPRVRGPRLLVVHGLDEGHGFALDAREGKTDWTIGRRWGLDVTLDYDPFVSLEHARVVFDHGGFAVEDLPTSRNGTALNWRMLPRGSRTPLELGDVIGVGKSLLLFRE